MIILKRLRNSIVKKVPFVVNFGKLCLLLVYVAKKTAKGQINGDADGVVSGNE